MDVPLFPAQITFAILGGLMLVYGLAADTKRWRDAVVSYTAGGLFAIGLAVSGMTQRSKVSSLH